MLIQDDRPFLLIIPSFIVFSFGAFRTADAMALVNISILCLVDMSLEGVIVTLYQLG